MGGGVLLDREPVFSDRDGKNSPEWVQANVLVPAALAVRELPKGLP